MLYEQILERDKNNPTVINELGDLCLKGNESRRAVTYFLSAAAKYRTTGLLNNAVAIYKKILRHDSENLNAHWYLAETRANQGLVVEGENHAVHFLDNSENVTGDIKEIFLKRCQSLFDLFPQSRVILSRVAQIFRVWTMNLEASRADCLIACMDFAGGNEAEARKQIDELTAKIPELMNYPEFAKWNGLVNPSSVEGSGFSDFGEVALGDEPAQPAVVEEAEPAIESVDQSEAAAAIDPDTSFGDLNLGLASAPEAVAETEIEIPVEPEVLETPEPVAAAPAAADPIPEPAPVADDSEMMRNGNPAAEELDDDGCFSIDDDDSDSSSFDELIAQATDGVDNTTAAVDSLTEAPAAEAPAAEPDFLAGLGESAGDSAESVDLLAQMLAEDGPDLVANNSSELDTIASEIGAVVGGGEGDDAERLYEMGMVYLEMGLFDQACESFETAAADESFSVRAHEMWGITLQRAERHVEAIKVLSSGLEFANDGSREQHGLMYHLGMAMEKTGRDDEAIECFGKINDEDPTFLDVGRRLAKLTSV